MRMIAAGTLALSCLAVCGCAGLPAGNAPAQGDFVIAIERAADVPSGSLYLKPVPGGLLGATADSELFRSKAGAKRIRISVDALAAQAEAHAGMARSDRFNPGELARPRELGITRIGTFYEPVAAVEGCSNFRTGLRLDAPGRAMLVYVDRAGSVRGARYTQPYIMDYRLEFPAAGIYVLAVRSRHMTIVQRVAHVTEPLRARVIRTGCD